MRSNTLVFLCFIFMVVIIASTYYFHGTSVMWWVISILIILVLLATLILEFNYNPDIDNIDGYKFIINKTELNRFKELSRVNKVDEMNQILKKYNDKIDAVDLSKSKLHDIDE